MLGALTATNVPTNVIYGNVGVWAGTAITGFASTSGVAVSDPPVTGGLMHSATGLAQSAQGQLTTARNDLASQGAGALLTADSAGPTNLSGALILDGGGGANAAWVFQMPSTLITSPNAVVSMVGTGSVAGLFRNVGSSAELGAYTRFMGDVLALTSVDTKTGASNQCGRLLADTGAVTLVQNSLSGQCGGALRGSGGLGAALT
ncbi:MAG: hypothetical protein ACI9ZH_002054 [Paracoccaceae bacterium]